METLLAMQIQISLAILLILLFRCCLTRLPRRWSYGLWIIIFLRLLIPVSLESPLGVLPDEETLSGLWQQDSVPGEMTNMRDAGQDVQGYYGEGEKGAIWSVNPDQVEKDEKGMPLEAGTADKNLRENQAGYERKPEKTDNVSRQSVWFRFFWLSLWLTGLLTVLGYNLHALFRLYRQVRGAKQQEEGVFCCPELVTPFVIGVLHPKIYLPANMGPEQRAYILCHERVHILRKDYLVKGIAFVLTALYWYNPLVWVAFYMLEQDMEMSCDEAVVKRLGEDVRKAYSQSLLDFAASGQGAAMVPLAFGENSIKSRVKNVLKKKNIRPWGALAGGAAVAVVAVLVFTTHDSRSGEPSAPRDKQDAEQQILPEELKAYSDKVAEEVKRQLQESKEFQQIQQEYIAGQLQESREDSSEQAEDAGQPAFKPGDQLTELPWDIYQQIPGGEGIFYLNTRYGIYRKEIGTDGDAYICLFPRYIGHDARLTLHPNLNMLYFVTDSEYQEWSLDWYDNCIMRLDLDTLETEIVAKDQSSGPAQDWWDQIDAFYGLHTGKNDKQKSEEGEDLSDQYELVRSLEADVADCPGNERIEISTVRADSELAGIYGGMVKIFNAEGELLMTETADPSSPGRNSLYLGQQDGQSFLMNFYLEDRGGFGCYEYQVYRLTADGEIQQIDNSRFEWDYAEMRNENALLYNDGVLRGWVEKLQKYMEDGQLLLSTLEYEVETGPETNSYRYNYDALTRGNAGEGLKGRE